MAKTKKFKVRLFGTLPCSAEMEVEAKNADAAKEWAWENSERFPWDGADYERPEGCTVEVGSVEEIEQD